jgi:hypothetical protein
LQAFTLHFEVAFILLPVCRNLISLLRRTPLGGVIPFDKNSGPLVGWFAVVIVWQSPSTSSWPGQWLPSRECRPAVRPARVLTRCSHIIAHMFNFGRLAIETKTGFVGFLGAK